MKVRIIVPCFNCKETLCKLLEHLAQFDEISLDQILVVDDGSTDGTGDMLQSGFPAVKVIPGTGTLYWTGAIRLGMQHALDAGADVIFWLNHDCRPVRGAFTELIGVLRDPLAGCVSGYCRIAGYPDYPVNPGFRNFRPLQIIGDDPIRVDGVNGNFVGFRSEAIRSTGLPEAEKHPHYGDGPYTYRINRKGFKVLVAPRARADLDYELARRLSPFWRVAVEEGTIAFWLHYYFFSFKSQYHWKYRWNDAVAFRGPMALFSYPKTELQALAGILAGSLARLFLSRQRLARNCVKRLPKRWPVEKLETELGLLEKGETP